MEKNIKIFTPVGMLGYGFSTELLEIALERGADAIIVDSGSTDSGPQKLGLGSKTVPSDSYKRDLKPLVDAAFHKKVKVLIGSAGGDGSNAHVDELAGYVEAHAKQQGYKLKVLRIYSEIPKSIVEKAFDEGTVEPCDGSPPLDREEIAKATRIVAQMGMEPYLEAMREHPDFDIIIGGRAYDPSPYAAFCYYRGFIDLGIAYHMGKVMECGGLCLTPKSKSAFATIWHDRFEISSVEDSVKCTIESLAAHTLYEKTRPDLLQGPGGTLDLRQAKYELSEDGKSAVSYGAKFITTPYKVKLEGAKVAGYKSMFGGSIADPILASQATWFLESVKRYVKQQIPGKYTIHFDVYGNSSLPAPATSSASRSPGIFVLAKILADTQALANSVASMTRVAVIHGPYPNQKATSGNFAMPLIPLEIPLGVHCEFNIYHLIPVDEGDQTGWFNVLATSVDGKAIPNPRFFQVVQNGVSNGISASATPHGKIPPIPSVKLPVEMQAPKSPATRFLHSFAKVIRSKNAGPFELTFDVIFDSVESFQTVRNSGVLSANRLAELYQIDQSDIIALLFFEPARAFKFTIRRSISSGNFLDSDLHGSQQHVPLMFVEIPA